MKTTGKQEGTMDQYEIRVEQGERHGRQAWFVSIREVGSRQGFFEELETEADAREYAKLMQAMSNEVAGAEEIRDETSIVWEERHW